MLICEICQEVVEVTFDVEAVQGNASVLFNVCLDCASDENLLAEEIASWAY